MSTQLLWFATRGAGIVSLLLLTAVLALGILTSMRWQSRSWPRWLTAELHRNLSLLSVAFLVLHVVTAVLDPYTSLGFLAAVVPFASTYRPLWVALGVLSMHIGIALVVTSLLRNRIGLRTWRLVHWLAYAAWPLALAHTVGAGTDGMAPWMLAIDVACIGAVALATSWRVWATLGANRLALEHVAAGGERRGSVR